MAYIKGLGDSFAMKKRLKMAYSYAPNFSFWPKSFIEQTQEASKRLSVPHIGIIMAAVINLEFFMAYSEVMLEESDWREPLLSWIIMHMPSGTRKSAIYSFLENNLYEKAISIIRDTYQLNQKDTDYIVHETTFEKLGLLLQENEGKKLWIHDEIRHFWAQMGLYNKSGSGCRDESVLLSLYNGGKWNHDTASSTTFQNEKTNLVLAGLTQTKHLLKLLQSEEKIDSGLLPRFFWLLLKPTSTDIDDLRPVDQLFKDDLVGLLVRAYHEHHCPETGKVVYILKRSSPAYQSFKCEYRKISDELQKNFEDIKNDVKSTFEGKNAGKILRLAGILSYMFQVLDRDSCMAYESEKSQEYGAEPCNVDFLEINCMAMDAAIDLVTMSHKQMIAILGFTDDHEIMGTLSDLGKAILSGGTCLSSIKLNVERFAGRKTNRKYIHELFGQMEELGMGRILMKSRTPVFQIRDDIIELARNDTGFRKMLYSHGISLAALEVSLSRNQDSIKENPGKPVDIASSKEKPSTSKTAISNETELSTSSSKEDTPNENMFAFAEHIFHKGLDSTLKQNETTKQRSNSQKTDDACASDSLGKSGKNKLKRVLKDVSSKFKHSTPIRANSNIDMPFDSSFNDFEGDETRISFGGENSRISSQRADNDNISHKKARKGYTIPKGSFYDI